MPPVSPAFSRWQTGWLFGKADGLIDGANTPSKEVANDDGTDT